MFWRTRLLLSVGLLELGGAVSDNCAAWVKGEAALKPFPALAWHTQEADSAAWLSHDDGIPVYYWELPDEFDDHYFNVRFTAPDSCRLLRAAFVFMKLPDDTLSTVPDVHVLVWNSGGILPAGNPDNALDSVSVADEAVVLATESEPDTTYVNLETLDLHFSAGASFHIGWEPFLTDAGDGPLAIMSDDGDPSTTFSIEWWQLTDSTGIWGTMEDDYGYGVNFMLRVEVDTYAPLDAPVWLAPDAPADFDLAGPFPNPFNPAAEFVIELARPAEVRLQVWDARGRQVQDLFQGRLPAGQNRVIWQAEGLPSGAYVVSLTSAGASVARQALLLK